MSRGIVKANRVFLADVVGPDRAPYEAALLIESGAEVTRDPGARWYVNCHDPVAAAWLAAQARIREQAQAAADLDKRIARSLHG